MNSYREFKSHKDGEGRAKKRENGGSHQNRLLQETGEGAGSHSAGLGMSEEGHTGLRRKMLM